MSKRKTAIDRAIENVDEKIAGHENEIKSLQLARAHLVQQQRERGQPPDGGESDR